MSRSARRSGLGAAAAVLLLGAAGSAAADEELLVGAAVSLRAPVVEIAQGFEATRSGASVALSFGASSAVAQQIRAGAPIDVFVSADERWIDALEADGLVSPASRRTVAANRLVVVAAADANFPLEKARDLLRPEVRRIAVPEAAVPVGRYAREWLDRHGLADLLAPRMLPTEHARATLAAVDLGHADVAIVYATDARLARTARVAFEVPEAEQPRIRYVAARVAHADEAALADAFLDHLVGAEAHATLRVAGFRDPAPRPARGE